MNKFTNDESERKYQNVYKVGGKMPVKKVVKKKKPTMNEIFNVGKKKIIIYLSFISSICFLVFLCLAI